MVWISSWHVVFWELLCTGVCLSKLCLVISVFHRWTPIWSWTHLRENYSRQESSVHNLEWHNRVRISISSSDWKFDSFKIRFTTQCAKSKGVWILTEVTVIPFLIPSSYEHCTVCKNNIFFALPWPYFQSTRVSWTRHTEYLYKWLRWTLACNRVKRNRASNSQITAAKGNIKVTTMQTETQGDTSYFCLQYICRIGTVHRITDRGDVRVQYSNNIRWTFHPGALTKVLSYR